MQIFLHKNTVIRRKVDKKDTEEEIREKIRGKTKKVTIP